MVPSSKNSDKIFRSEKRQPRGKSLYEKNARQSVFCNRGYLADTCRRYFHACQNLHLYEKSLDKKITYLAPKAEILKTKSISERM